VGYEAESAALHVVNGVEPSLSMGGNKAETIQL
jgi:hypothetical protein